MKPAPRGVWLGRIAVAGPVAFTVAWLAGGYAQHEYSVRREDVSALAALDAQNAWIMITGFVLLGVGTVALGAGLASALTGRSAVIGAVLLMIAGVSIVIAGLARNDCSSELTACANRVDAGQVSWHHSIHDTISLVIFLALVAAPLVLARAVRGDDRWRDLRVYSVITGIVTLVLLVLFISSAAGSWNGALERVFISVPFLWIAVMGFRLARVSEARDSMPAAGLPA
jgi:hypothetical membrane protein